MLPDIAEDALLCDYQMEGVKSSPCLKYEEEWLTLSKVDLEMTGLKEKIIDGELRASRFRSVIWRLLLGALTPGYPENWPEEARRSREHYKQLKESIEVTPSALSEPNRDNPLSTNERSSWHQYFCDKELKSLIRQDVIRTFPGIDFFRSEEIQQSMINILFCYARENPLMCYRQGMHEVLAPVIFVVKSDHHALLHTKEQIELRPDILDVVNPDYFENDSYTLFRRIMNAIEGSYLISNVAPTSTGYFPGTSCSINTTENQVLAQLNWIKEHLLAPSDPELHDHLAKLDIPLPLFGIRWLRLLFGREFPLQDLLVLWDAIFAENRCFDLVNYIVVAMLSAVRKKLLDSDYANCLTTLMRYPGASDISLIIDYALHLKNPAVHKIPPKLIIPAPVRKTDQKTNKSVPNRSNAMNGNSKKLPTTQNHRPSPPNNVYKPNGTVIDGYLLNDPERLLKELKQSQSIMSLCSMKLVQYFNVLQKSVNHDDIQGQLALTGIQELSNLLSDNVRNGEAVNVEPALEAQEKTPTSIAPVTLRNDSVAPIPARPRSVDMTVFSRTYTPINDVDYEGKEFFLSSLKLS